MAFWMVGGATKKKPFLFGWAAGHIWDDDRTLISPCMKGGLGGGDTTSKSPKSEAVENMGASVLTFK